MPVMRYVADLFRGWRGHVAAGALAGAVLLGAAGYSLKRDAIYDTRPVPDKSRPIMTEAVPEKRVLENVTYTFRRGDKAELVVAGFYKLTNPTAIANRVNAEARSNAPNHRHRGNHLLKDTRAVVKGKLVKEGEPDFRRDYELFDEIQAGETVVFHDVESVIPAQPPQPTGKYHTKPERYAVREGRPSRAGYGALLGALLGGLGGYGVYRLRQRGAQGGPEGDAPAGGGPGGAGPAGGGAPAGRGRRGLFRLIHFGRRGQDREGAEGGAQGGQGDGPEALNYSGKDRKEGNDPQAVVNITDYRGRRRLNDSELERAKRNITEAYRGGFGDVSASRLANDYVGLKTADVYRMLAEDKIANQGTAYKWNRRLAETTGELAQIESIALEGTASDAARRIKDATGFEMSRSTIYRMRNKLIPKAEKQAA